MLKKFIMCLAESFWVLLVHFDKNVTMNEKKKRHVCKKIISMENVFKNAQDFKIWLWIEDKECNANERKISLDHDTTKNQEVPK